MVFPGMSKGLEGILGRIVLQSELPPREMLEVASQPNIDVAVLFTDTMSRNLGIEQQLKEGNYHLMLVYTYGHAGEELKEEYFNARLVEAFRALRPELKETLGEEFAKYAAQVPERFGSSDEYFKAWVKALLVHGIKPVYQRATHEESKQLEMLRVFARLTGKTIMDGFLEGDFNAFLNYYAVRLSALYANYSISTGSFKRTIEQLPELAGRRFMGLPADNLRVILPLEDAYLFAKDDLLSSANGKVSFTLHPDLLLPLYYQVQIMAFLRQNGVIPAGITSRDALFEFHNKKVTPVYRTITEHIARGAFSFILISPSLLGEFAHGYDLEVLSSGVASQFSVGDIAALTEQAKTARSTEAFIQKIGDLAAKRGYSYPHTKEEASAIIHDIKQAAYKNQ